MSGCRENIFLCFRSKDIFTHSTLLHVVFFITVFSTSRSLKVNYELLIIVIKGFSCIWTISTLIVSTLVKVMSLSGINLLLYDNGITHGTLLSFSKTSIGTIRSYCGDSYIRVMSKRFKNKGIVGCNVAANGTLKFNRTFAGLGTSGINCDSRSRHKIMRSTQCNDSGLNYCSTITFVVYFDVSSCCTSRLYALYLYLLSLISRNVAKRCECSLNSGGFGTTVTGINIVFVTFRIAGRSHARFHGMLRVMNYIFSFCCNANFTTGTSLGNLNNLFGVTIAFNDNGFISLRPNMLVSSSKQHDIVTAYHTNGRVRCRSVLASVFFVCRSVVMISVERIGKLFATEISGLKLCERNHCQSNKRNEYYSEELKVEPSSQAEGKRAINAVL